MCLAHTADALRNAEPGGGGHDHPHAHDLPRADGSRIGRRTALLAGAGAALTALLPGTAGAAARPAGHSRHGLADLTHTFRTDFPVYVLAEEATRRTHVTIEEDGYYLQEWTFYEHTATHVDAPGHFAPGGRLAPDLTVEELVVPAAVVDIAARAQVDPDTEVTVDDLRAHERSHGRIPPRAAVLMYSGWQARLAEPGAYRGADAEGVPHFPGFGAEAVDWLVRRRRISAVGVDTLSLDPGPSTTFDTHATLLGADRYGLENVANLERIPPRGREWSWGWSPGRRAREAPVASSRSGGRPARASCSAATSALKASSPRAAGPPKRSSTRCTGGSPP